MANFPHIRAFILILFIITIHFCLASLSTGLSRRSNNENVAKTETRTKDKSQNSGLQQRMILERINQEFRPVSLPSSYSNYRTSQTGLKYQGMQSGVQPGLLLYLNFNKSMSTGQDQQFQPALRGNVSATTPAYPEQRKSTTKYTPATKYVITPVLVYEQTRKTNVTAPIWPHYDQRKSTKEYTLTTTPDSQVSFLARTNRSSLMITLESLLHLLEEFAPLEQGEVTGSTTSSPSNTRTPQLDTRENFSNIYLKPHDTKCCTSSASPGLPSYLIPVAQQDTFPTPVTMSPKLLVSTQDFTRQSLFIDDHSDVVYEFDRSGWRLKAKEDTAPSKKQKILFIKPCDQDSNTYVEISSQLISQEGLVCRLRLESSPEHLLYGGWHRLHKDGSLVSDLTCMASRNLSNYEDPWRNPKVEAVRYSSRKFQEKQMEKDDEEVHIEFSKEEAQSGDHVCIFVDNAQGQQEQVLYISDVVQVEILETRLKQSDILKPKVMKTAEDIAQQCSYFHNKGYNVTWHGFNGNRLNASRLIRRSKVPQKSDKQNTDRGLESIARENRFLYCIVERHAEAVAAEFGFFFRKMVRVFELDNEPQLQTVTPQPARFPRFIFKAIEGEELKLKCQGTGSHFQELPPTEKCPLTWPPNPQISPRVLEKFVTLPREASGEHHCFLCNDNVMGPVLVDIDVQKPLHEIIPLLVKLNDNTKCPEKTSLINEDIRVVRQNDKCFQNNIHLYSESSHYNYQIGTNRRSTFKKKGNSKLVHIGFRAYFTQREFSVCLEESWSQEHEDTNHELVTILPCVMVVGIVLIISVVVVLLKRKQIKFSICTARCFRSRDNSTEIRHSDIDLDRRVEDGGYERPVDLDMLKSEAIRNSQLTIKGVLSSGKFETVFKAKVLDLPKVGKTTLVAIKGKRRASRTNGGGGSFTSSKLWHEIEILKRIPPHENIVGYFGFSFNSEYDFIVTEFVHGSSLKEYLQQLVKKVNLGSLALTSSNIDEEGGRSKEVSPNTNIYHDTYISDQSVSQGNSRYIGRNFLLGKSRGKGNIELSQELCFISREIAKAMAYLSSLNIVHGNMCTENVLIQHPKLPLFVKLYDFECSVQLPCGRSCVEVQPMEKMKIGWMSPEFIKSNEMSEVSDVWAYGVTTWEVFAFGAPPFTGDLSAEEIKSRVQQLRMPFRPEYLDTKIYDDLICACWRKNPRERPTFEKVLSLWQAMMSNKPDLCSVYSEDEHPVYCEIDGIGETDVDNC